MQNISKHYKYFQFFRRSLLLVFLIALAPILSKADTCPPGRSCPYGSSIPDDGDHLYFPMAPAASKAPRASTRPAKSKSTSSPTVSDPGCPDGSSRKNGQCVDDGSFNSQATACPDGSSAGADGKCVDDGSFKNDPAAKTDGTNCEKGTQQDGYGCTPIGTASGGTNTGGSSCTQDPYGKTADIPNGQHYTIPDGNGGAAGTYICKDGQWAVADTSQNKTAAGDPCADAASSADNFCKGSDMAAKVQEVTLQGLMSSAQNANGAQACQVAAKVAGMQAAFSTGLAAACETMIQKCEAACSNPTQAQQPTWTQNMTKCASHQSTVFIAGMEAAKQLVVSQASSNCQTGYTASAIPMPPMAAVPGVMDCSNTTYAQQNVLTCFCQTHAGDPKCVNQALAPLGGVTNSRTTADTKSGMTPSIPNGVPTFGLPPNAQNTNGTGTAQNPNAAGGSNGSGGGLPGGSGVAAAGVAEDPAAQQGSPGGGSVFGGFGSGQGGFSYGRGAGGSGDGGSTAGGMLKTLAAKLNLNKILPKRNDYLNRSVAGMSGASRDGVTGPNGPSIWEKVSRRYQIKKGELLPP